MDRAASEAPHPATDVAGWAERAFARLAGLAGVRRVGLALVEGGGRRLRFTASDRDGGAEVAWCHVDAYDDVPLNTAVRTGEPVIGAIDELRNRYAEFATAQRGTGHLALAAVPVVGKAEILGGFVLFFDRPQQFDDAQCRELAGLGRALGEDLLRILRSRARRPTVAGSDVTSPPGALVAVHEVAGDPAAVGQARRSVRKTLLVWDLDEDMVDAATLCLSELMTNAVLHAEGGCVVRIVMNNGLLTASVRDGGVAGVVPAGPVADPMQVHGRGLQVVEALATRWGYDIDADGASVWFVLDVG